MTYTFDDYQPEWKSVKIRRTTKQAEFKNNQSL